MGDIVRISSHRDWFEKSYEGNWSPAQFIVSEVKNTYPPTYLPKGPHSSMDWSGGSVRSDMFANLSANEWLTWTSRGRVRLGLGVRAFDARAHDPTRTNPGYFYNVCPSSDLSDHFRAVRSLYLVRRSSTERFDNVF